MSMHPLGPNPLALPVADTAFAGGRSGFAFAGYVFDMRRDRLTKDGVAVVLARSHARSYGISSAIQNG